MLGNMFNLSVHCSYYIGVLKCSFQRISYSFIMFLLIKYYILGPEAML